MRAQSRSCARTVFAVVALLLVAISTAAASPHLLAQLEGCGGDAVAFSPDGARILTANRHHLRIWDSRSFKPLILCMDHGATIQSAMWISGGARVASIGRNEICLWDAKNGKLLTHFARATGSGPVAVSRDGRWVATDLRGGHAALWDAVTGKRVRLLEGGQQVHWVGFSNDGSLVMTYVRDHPDDGGFGGTLHVRDVTTDRRIIPPQTSDDWMMSDPIALISNDNQRIVIASEKGFDVFQLQGFKKISRRSVIVDSLEMGCTGGIRLASDGTRIIWWSIDGYVATFRSDNGEAFGKTLWSCEFPLANGFDINSSGAFAVVSGPAEDTGVWDVEELELVQMLGSRTSNCAGLSPDGTCAAVGYDHDTYDYHGGDGYTKIWRLDPLTLPPGAK